MCIIVKNIKIMIRLHVFSEKSGNFASEILKPMIYVESKRKNLKDIEKQYPDGMIIDVTSKAKDEFVKFSPLYPIGGIPVPFTEGLIAVSVEGIWQGLKVFEYVDADLTYLSKRDMKNIKRTARNNGPYAGHLKGARGKVLLNEIEARKLIFLPCYKWVLENKLKKLVKAIRDISNNKPVVLLDYNTNPDVNNPKRPLSHASLIKAYIEGNYPQ